MIHLLHSNSFIPQPSLVGCAKLNICRIQNILPSVLSFNMRNQFFFFYSLKYIFHHFSPGYSISYCNNNLSSGLRYLLNNQFFSRKPPSRDLGYQYIGRLKIYIQDANCNFQTKNDKKIQLIYYFYGWPKNCCVKKQIRCFKFHSLYNKKSTYLILVDSSSNRAMVEYPTIR